MKHTANEMGFAVSVEDAETGHLAQTKLGSAPVKEEGKKAEFATAASVLADLSSDSALLVRAFEERVEASHLGEQPGEPGGGGSTESERDEGRERARERDRARESKTAREREREKERARHVKQFRV